MKKQLISQAQKEKEQKDALIFKANNDILKLQNKLQRLEDGTDDETLKKVLEDLKATKNMIDGLLFLHRGLEDSLKIINKDKSDEFAKALENDIRINEQELRKSYKEYYRLLRKKLEINCNNRGKRKELKKSIDDARKVAANLTEEEFVKALVRIFRTNSFTNLYDSKDEYLNYSLGQIFLIKYAITQVSRYMDNYDFTPNMLRQIKILNNYTFKTSGKNLSNLDFVKCLKEGNLHLCDLNYPVLSYEEALKLYRHLTFTFFLPKQVGYTLKKSLK